MTAIPVYLSEHLGKQFKKDMKSMPEIYKPMQESHFTNIGETVSYLFRRFVHWHVKILNRMSGYKIWEEGKIPEV